jgi:hypothetical protein
MAGSSIGRAGRFASIFQAAGSSPAQSTIVFGAYPYARFQGWHIMDSQFHYDFFPKYFEVDMKYWTRFKSALTGLFVKKSFAEANPEKTYGTKVQRNLRKSSKPKKA